MNYIFCLILSIGITALTICADKKYNIIFKYRIFAYLFIVVSLFSAMSCMIYRADIRKLSMLGYSIVYILLFIISICDIKEMLVHKYLTYALMFVCALIMLLNPYTGVINNLVTGSFMTIACIVAYKLSGNKIGSGDVKVIASLSFALGYPLIFSLLFAAMFMAMIYGIVLIITKKATVRTEIPFIPFIFLGYIINVLNF